MIGDDYTQSAEFPSLAREKTTIGMGFSYGSLEIAEFQLSVSRRL
jgi:hypothetical protein